MEKYVIDEDDGLSIFIYIPNILDEKNYNKTKNYLQNINDWKCGKSYNNTLIKRKQKWFQKDNQYFCKKWKMKQDRWKSHNYNEVLINLQNIVQCEILKHIEKDKNIQIPNYNSKLINYYENGNNLIPPHRDSVDSFGLCPTISLISIGAKRNLVIERTLKDQLKRDKNKNILNKTFQLDDNSMFIMAGCSQRYWCHSIQKDDSKDERYSFSIREYL